jgi:hypothetical protein
MVERVIMSPRNVVDLARYRQGRGDAGKTPGISMRTCRHCGAVLSEGESEDECSSALNLEAPGLRGAPRKFYAD